MRKSFFGFVFFLTTMQYGWAQKNSATILSGLKDLNVLGSVMYIAAHPDDENNAFLPFLTKELHYRTAYLSLTRGDGGQNLIGKEQGVELGLIRTQELLAARKIDGAEQYFSTAYEFGFSKSAAEALRIWDHQKVLADVVWMIRKWQPDIIITRFPGDARAGHGHHAASSIIANEAFKAAADPNQFKEQFAFGVAPWQAKRIIWNTFNFGNVNTTNTNQFSVEVGGFNPLEGKSYGEIGAEARTMHKSQGEGRPRRRGTSKEFFETTGGEAPKETLLDGVDITWNRLGATSISTLVQKIITNYKLDNPSASVDDLVTLYQQVQQLPTSNWKEYKLQQIQQLIQDCAGILIECNATQSQFIRGDKVKAQLFINQRSGVASKINKVIAPGQTVAPKQALVYNQNQTFDLNWQVGSSAPLTQPYWLVKPQKEGMFDVTDYSLIGKAENDPVYSVLVQLEINGQSFDFVTPVQYKYVDPTRGDVYQPLSIVPTETYSLDKEVAVVAPNTKYNLGYDQLSNGKLVSHQVATITNSATSFLPDSAIYIRKIEYPHIPTLTYFPKPSFKLVSEAIKTKGKNIGYIDGAGDKVPEAVTALGLNVELLTENDLKPELLKKYDAIIVGIRAYNMYPYLTEKNDVLNQYIEQGGNLIVQYLKSNSVGVQAVKVGPYPFVVNASKRVTQENAEVQFILPDHVVLQSPNTITNQDFNNWIQERSTYQAENMDTHFQMPLSMHDDNEPASNGSLLIAPFGKGNMVYVSLALFRQLPAGNPGAYKLLANLIALPKH